MDTQFKVKLINHLNRKNQNKGFTLIELLVVVIIIGVLAAIALPNLLNQVAKGRQAEAKNNLGAINRAQQAYRLERASFGGQSRLPITVTGQYYSFTGGADSATFASHSATALTSYTNDVRDYGSAVAQDAAGNFDNAICEMDHPTRGLTALTGTGAALSCGGNSSEIN